jgi:hypothetical protein
MFYISYGLGFFATILIVIGVVALLTNLGVISAAIWNWWPLLLIVFAIYVLGLKKKKKKIFAGHIFHKLASDERIQEKIKKIVDTVDEVVDKKLDEWHEETTKEKRTR